MQYSQDMGGKGDVLMCWREMDNLLPGDMTAGQNVTEGIRRKSYSEVVIEEESKGVCVGFDSQED